MKATMLVIDRAKWLRGEGAGNSYLLRAKDGKMCCLGFYCLQLGYTAEEIADHSTPAWMPKFISMDERDIPENIKPLIDVSTGRDSDLCNELTCINDQPGTPAEEREAAIIAGFAKMGIEVLFIN